MFGYIYKKDVAIIAVILCLCLGVGSFFDYQISCALFNIGSMYGRFIEAAGEHRRRYARASGASRLQGEQMARRARHPR